MSILVKVEAMWIIKTVNIKNVISITERILLYAIGKKVKLYEH